MSEKLCALRKIGGGMSEKALWTNANPNTNFGVNDITLPQDVDDFKFLKFTYKATTSNNTLGEVIISVDELKTSIASGVANTVTLAARNGTAIYARMVFYQTDTSLQITRSHHIYGTDFNDSLAIPLQIIGLK